MPARTCCCTRCWTSPIREVSLDIVEHSFTCPYCWESITMLLDLSVEAQEYVEDCEVCCNPIAVSVHADAGGLQSFEVIAQALSCGGRHGAVAHAIDTGRVSIHNIGF